MIHIRLYLKRSLFITIPLLFLSFFIFVYSNHYLPYQAFEKNIEVLNDYSKIDTLELENYEFLELYVVADPVNLLGISPDIAAIRDLSKITIKPSLNIVTTNNLTDPSKSKETTLTNDSFFEQYIFNNDLDKQFWLQIAQDRSYQLIDQGSDWLYRIDEKIINNQYEKFLRVNGLLSNEKLSAFNSDDFSLKYSHTELLGPLNIEFRINKKSQKITSIKVKSEDGFKVFWRLILSNNLLEKIPPEYGYNKVNYINLVFDEIDFESNFKIIETVSEK